MIDEIPSIFTSWNHHEDEICMSLIYELIANVLKKYKVSIKFQETWNLIRPVFNK